MIQPFSGYLSACSVLDTKQALVIEREQITKTATLALHLSPWNLDSDRVMSLSQLQLIVAA